MFRTITDHFWVSPQISLADVDTAKAEGVTMIVNNRHDGEEPDAPQHADIAAAAEAAGLAYLALPVTGAGFSAPQVDALADAIAAQKAAGGRILAYCRSGNRSTLLWSLASARAGGNPVSIAAKAATAGYDITPVRPMVDALAAAHDD